MIYSSTKALENDLSVEIQNLISKDNNACVIIAKYIKLNALYTFVYPYQTYSLITLYDVKSRASNVVSNTKYNVENVLRLNMC